MDLTQTPSYKAYKALEAAGKLIRGKWVVVVADDLFWTYDTAAEAKERYGLIDSPAHNPVVMLRHGHSIEIPELHTIR